jgi:hypothetical protein
LMWKDCEMDMITNGLGRQRTENLSGEKESFEPKTFRSR